MYSFWYQHLGLNQQLLYHFLAQWLLSSFLVSLRIGRASLFLICYFEFIYFFYKDSLLLFIRVLGIYKFLDLLTFNFYWCLLKCILFTFFLYVKVEIILSNFQKNAFKIIQKDSFFMLHLTSIMPDDWFVYFLLSNNEILKQINTYYVFSEKLGN